MLGLENHLGDLAVSDKKHPFIPYYPKYASSTGNSEGSNRLLDQKLTQIMIELTQQNREIISCLVEPRSSDTMFLKESGFHIEPQRLQNLEHDPNQEILEQLSKFRSQEGNNLFPNNQDHPYRSAEFEKKDFDNNSVYYSKGEPDCWSNIIEKSPILNKGGGILPEYWAKKPLIVEE